MKNTNNKQKDCSLTIYEIIARYYYEFKAIAERETRKFNSFNGELDEDIFHNVLLSMAETLGRCGYVLTVKQAKGYLCNSFKNALCRETLYARNKYKNDITFEECMFKTKDGELDVRIDYNTLILEIEKRYGKECCDIFEDFMSGVKLRELNEKYQIKNADYIIRKVKNYIKNEYPEFKVKRRNGR